MKHTDRNCLKCNTLVCKNIQKYSTYTEEELNLIDHQQSNSINALAIFASNEHERITKQYPEWDVTIKYIGKEKVMYNGKVCVASSHIGVEPTEMGISK